MLQQVSSCSQYCVSPFLSSFNIFFFTAFTIFLGAYSSLISPNSKICCLPRLLACFPVSEIKIESVEGGGEERGEAILKYLSFVQIISQSMNSLIARVHMDVGKFQDNPTLSIYENTDVHTLISNFIEEWELPIIIHEQILDKIILELNTHLASSTANSQTPFPASINTQTSSSWRDDGNLSIQCEPYNKKKEEKNCFKDIYSPIQRLKPEFKGAPSNKENFNANKIKSNLKLGNQLKNGLAAETGGILTERSFNKREEAKAGKKGTNAISFKTMIEFRIRDIFYMLKGLGAKDHKYLIPELIEESRLHLEAREVLHEFLSSLKYEDYCCLNEQKFTRLVFEGNYASRFYKKFRF